VSITLPNPLRPLSMPFAIRAGVLTVVAVGLLLRSAHDMASGFSGGSSTVLSVALFLLGVAILDGVRTFWTRVDLPERSVGVGTIRCDGSQALQLMLSGINPNDKYLTWLGNWAARVSARFAGLPMPYQRLTEIAITAVGFALAAVAVFALSAAFGAATGNLTATTIVLGWLWYVFVMLAYLFWIAMLFNFATAARWARRLNSNRIVNTIGTCMVLLASTAFILQTRRTELAVAPEIRVEGLILVVGSVAMVSVLLVLARFRSSGTSAHLTRSRINVSHTAAVHPQSVPAAFTSVLAQSKGDKKYRELAVSTANLTGQTSSAGLFHATFAGEYGIEVTQVGPTPPLQRFATTVGSCGIALGGIALTLMALAARGASGHVWFTASAFLLFGELSVLVAYYPLSEVLCSSYLMSLKIDGNYQRRGTAGAGTIHTDFILDGGLARTTSVSFVRATMASFEMERALVSAEVDDEEKRAVLSAVRLHLTRAASP